MKILKACIEKMIDDSILDNNVSFAQAAFLEEKMDELLALVKKAKLEKKADKLNIMGLE
jgi:hypothetical protein